jgi:hypothetical protein
VDYGLDIHGDSEYEIFDGHEYLKMWPESVSELYRPSELRLSAKLVQTFADRRVSRSQRGGSSTAVISVF